MKLRLKGDSEWKEYELHFDENGSFMGVVYGKVRVTRSLPEIEHVLELFEPLLLPLECFDMWEEQGLQQARTQAAIAAMQGVMTFFGSFYYNAETIAKLAVKQADALIKELESKTSGTNGKQEI